MTKIDFPNMVYINMDSAVERKNSMESQMKNYGANITRYSAIYKNFNKYSRDWKMLLKNDDPNKADYNSEYLSIGEIGCLLSHLEVIRIYGNKDLIVFEDDTDLSTSKMWKFSLNDFINKLPKNIDILQMVKSNLNVPAYIEKYTFGNSWGTGAYYINSRLSKHIVDTYFINGKWNIADMNSKWHRKPIDAILYSFDNAYTCTVFSLLDYGSHISDKKFLSILGDQIKEYLSGLDLTIGFYFDNIENKINRRYWNNK